MKIVKKSTENCLFTAVKNHCMLHGRVFVMWSKFQLNKSSNKYLNSFEIRVVDGLSNKGIRINQFNQNFLELFKKINYLD